TGHFSPGRTHPSKQGHPDGTGSVRPGSALYPTRKRDRSGCRPSRTRENGTVKRTVVFTAGVLALGLAGYLGSHLRAQQAGNAPAAPAFTEPRTRIALINLAYVIKNYKKTETFQSEIKAEFKTFEGRAQAKQTEYEQRAKHASDPGTTAQQREADQADM